MIAQCGDIDTGIPDDYKKGDIETSVKFFDEAINLETDNAKKAEKAYAAASVLTTAKKLSQARS